MAEIVPFSGGNTKRGSVVMRGSDGLWLLQTGGGRRQQTDTARSQESVVHKGLGRAPCPRRACGNSSAFLLAVAQPQQPLGEVNPGLVDIDYFSAACQWNWCSEWQHHFCSFIYSANIHEDSNTSLNTGDAIWIRQSPCSLGDHSGKDKYIIKCQTLIRAVSHTAGRWVEEQAEERVSAKALRSVQAGALEEQRELDSVSRARWAGGRVGRREQRWHLEGQVWSRCQVICPHSCGKLFFRTWPFSPYGPNFHKASLPL